MKRKDFEVPAQQGSVTYERKGITSEIVIPLLACTLFGLGIALALAIVQWGILNIPPKDAFQFAGAIGLLAMSLALTWRFFKAVVWIAEEATRRDLDQDGWVGEPEPRIITVRGGNGGSAVSKYKQTRQALETFVRGCEVDTSMRRWEPSIGRQKYLTFRTVLMEAGHAAWINNDRHQGWELTAPADDIIAGFN
ncbi:MAG: hypothetical protein H8E90_08675 [Anaerolineales bacterium]|nr:hypothetical protein [Anaerolineales bacterium]